MPASWFHAACFGAVLASAILSPTPVRADFFDDARRTFQTDIPHFFQDDVPCAFGGQPTSHARTACKPDRPASKPAAAPPPRPAAAPADGRRR